MDSNMWTFILCLTSMAMYQAAGKTEILLEEPRRGVLWSWHTTRKDVSGAGWNLASSGKAYSVCDITIAREPTNWLRTDFIDVKDAKMLNIKLTYNLRRCPPTASSFCKHKWSIYVLHVEKEVVGVDLNPFTANELTYEEVETIEPTVLPAPGEIESYDYDVKIITKKGGVYLAFLDQGACLSLNSVNVSYNYCSETDRVLVRFSRAAAPVNDSFLEEQTGHCTDVNSVNTVKLSGVCLSNGEWNITDAIKCLCKPGYELVNGSGGNVLACSACLKGFYKSVASNSKCEECPANSASNTGRTGCLCHEGFYKKPGLRVAPCKALPKAPRNANVTVVKETYVEIMWERTPDESDGKLRYSVDCFRCKSSKYKDCKESCGPSVQYKPNKDNVTDGTVAVNGLPSDSFLKFRVYSVNELNAQEKDRDKWNYVTVSAKTKVCPRGFFKSVASNSKCDECPANSASNTGRTDCLCHEGFYKKPGLHGTSCKALPKAPRNANATVVKATYVEIMWERSPDEIGGKLRYSVDCFRCKSSEYKDCKESCGGNVEYKPNKDNNTGGTVKINGLPSNSFLKVRVYSVNELNEQEKDRNKWNYVTVSAKTKDPGVQSPKGGSPIEADVPTDGGSSSKAKTVVTGAAGGGLLLLILAITMII